MPKKIAIVESCEGCPHFDPDPADEKPEHWGAPSCRHHLIGIRCVDDIEDISAWCPLPDAS